MARRLNVGSGPTPAVGWTNIDVDPWDGGIDHVGRVEDGLPWTAGVFDYAVCHHVLQAVAWPDLVPFLAEVRRVTRHGGVLRMSVPNLAAAMYAYRIGDHDWFPIADAVETSIDGKLAVYITQAGATRSVFTPRYMGEVLVRAGWSLVTFVHHGHTWFGPDEIVELDSRPHESIYVEAIS